MSDCEKVNSRAGNPNAGDVDAPQCAKLTDGQEGDTERAAILAELPTWWLLLVVSFCALICLPPIGVASWVLTLLIRGRYAACERRPTAENASAVRQMHKLTVRVSILGIYWGLVLWIILLLFLMSYNAIPEKILLLNQGVFLKLF